jgi:hypothetical protein
LSYSERPVSSASCRKTGFPEKWFPKLRFRLQVSDMPTIRPSALRSMLDERIGDYVLIEIVHETALMSKLFVEAKWRKNK